MHSSLVPITGGKETEPKVEHPAAFPWSLAVVTASKVRARNKRYVIFKQDDRNMGGCVQSTVFLASLNLPLC